MATERKMTVFCAPDTQSGISVFIFRPADNLHPTASECKVQSISMFIMV